MNVEELFKHYGLWAIPLILLTGFLLEAVRRISSFVLDGAQRHMFLTKTLTAKAVQIAILVWGLFHLQHKGQVTTGDIQYAFMLGFLISTIGDVTALAIGDLIWKALDSIWRAQIAFQGTAHQLATAISEVSDDTWKGHSALTDLVGHLADTLGRSVSVMTSVVTRQETKGHRKGED